MSIGGGPSTGQRGISWGGLLVPGRSKLAPLCLWGWVHSAWGKILLGVLVLGSRTCNARFGLGRIWAGAYYGWVGDGPVSIGWVLASWGCGRLWGWAKRGPLHVRGFRVGRGALVSPWVETLVSSWLKSMIFIFWSWSYRKMVDARTSRQPIDPSQVTKRP